jgi:hypothetical protein
MLLAALAGTLVLQACAFTPNTATTNVSAPGIEPVASAVMQTGTDLKVSLEGTRFATQYVSGDIEEILIGIYDTNPGNPVNPDGPLNFAFSLGGWWKTDAAAGYNFTGVEYPLPCFDTVRYLVGQDIDEPTQMMLQNGRYMVRHLTKTGGGFTSPTVYQNTTFYNIPDGNYKLFAVAIKNGVVIGRDVEPLNFDASDRVFYNGNTGRSYVNPNIVPVLCLDLDPNPDVNSHVGIHDNTDTPNYGD